VDRGFRFGYQLSEADEADPLEAAKLAEASGFDVVLVGDHVGPGVSPLITLSAIAQVTDRVRLGTLVLNHDMRNPVQLAWESATLDRLSRGRFELGLGAGHTPREYTATGLTMDRPSRRKARLMEGVEVIRRLLDGEVVTFEGAHIRIEDAVIDPAHQSRLPILVGGNGEALLAHAGANADIVGLQGLGRPRSDGHSHAVKWEPAWLDRQIEQVRSGAGDRFSAIEMNALVQVTRFTDDRSAFIKEVLNRIDGLSADDARATPYLLFGTPDEIAAKIHACRERWGISYFVVRECAEFSDVINALR
jgi:probable F420-dependent oxidoreductase